MQDERDFLTLTDDDGNEINFEVLRFFFYNGEEYAMVAEAEEGCGCDCEDCHEGHECHEEGCDCGCDECEPLEVFFMKVEAVDEENEEFTFVDEELSQKLLAVIEAEYDAEEDEE